MPSRPGICRSSTATSTCSLTAIATASSPVAASATTERSSSRSSICASATRIRCSSSASRMRIGSLIWHSVHRVRTVAGQRRHQHERRVAPGRAQRRPQRRQPLAQAVEPGAALGARAGHAVVGHDQLVGRPLDRDPGRRRVPQHVGDRLADHPARGLLPGVGHPVDGQPDLDAGRAQQRPRTFQLLVEVDRAVAAGQLARLAQRLVGDRRAPRASARPPARHRARPGWRPAPTAPRSSRAGDRARRARRGRSAAAPRRRPAPTGRSSPGRARSRRGAARARCGP